MKYGNYSGRYTNLLDKYRAVPQQATAQQPVSIPTTPFTPVTPELEGLKHVSTPETMYNVRQEEPSAGVQGVKPYSAGIDVGLSEKERTNIFNVGRGRIQTSTNVAMEQMKEILGEKGFRAGDSGLADTILGKIAMKGQEELSGFGRQIEAQESVRRFMESITKGKFGLEEKRFGLEGEKFEYGQSMQAIQMLMQLFGMGQQNQQAGYAPYWQSILGYGG